jgi:hypothetical protein
MVGGWYEGLAFTEAKNLAAGMPTGTVGEYVDSLCQLLCFQLFHPPQRDALVGFLGGDPAMSSQRAGLDWKCHELAALVLDSPYFTLR